METISRLEAKKLGLTSYFTGVPCKNGHTAPRNTNSGVCYKCSNQGGMNWYNKNKNNLQWKKERIIKNVKHRSKAKNIDFNITVDDLVWPTHCPVLGTELDYSGQDRWRQVSLDRTDPKKGYIKGNVVVMSMRANSIKYDATIGELQKVISYMEQLSSST